MDAMTMEVLGAGVIVGAALLATSHNEIPSWVGTIVTPVAVVGLILARRLFGPGTIDGYKAALEARDREIERLATDNTAMRRFIEDSLFPAVRDQASAAGAHAATMAEMIEEFRSWRRNR